MSSVLLTNSFLGNRGEFAASEVDHHEPVEIGVFGVKPVSTSLDSLAETLAGKIGKSFFETRRSTPSCFQTNLFRPFNRSSNSVTVNPICQLAISGSKPLSKEAIRKQRIQVRKNRLTKFQTLFKVPDYHLGFYNSKQVKQCMLLFELAKQIEEIFFIRFDHLRETPEGMLLLEDRLALLEEVNKCASNLTKRIGPSKVKNRPIFAPTRLKKLVIRVEKVAQELHFLLGVVQAKFSKTRPCYLNADLINNLERQLAGARYTISSDELGAGSYSSVWGLLLTPPKGSATAEIALAAKTSYEEGVSDSNEIALSMAITSHPNILQVVGAPEVRGRRYLALPQKDTDLARAVTKRRVSLNDVPVLFMQILEAVQHLHDHRILHRDIKPENILLERIDGAWNPLICDHGLAELEEEEHHTSGTPSYSAPEIVSGDANLIQTSVDIWSLGISFFRILTGESLLSLLGQQFSESKKAMSEVDILKKIWSNPESTQKIICLLIEQLGTGELPISLKSTGEIPPEYLEILQKVLKSMLVVAPQKRATAREALEILTLQGSLFEENQERDPSQEEKK